MKARLAITWGGLALVLLTITALVVQKQRVLAVGEPVLLELGPVDPRSLIEGDYMRLRYAIAADPGWPDDGKMVLARDADRIGKKLRLFYEGDSLAAGEIVLRYRRRDGDTRLGAESFHFQEGMASDFSSARYGELRVAPSGESVLVGLRDRDRRALGPSLDSGAP